jgi:peroxiredoxin
LAARRDELAALGAEVVVLGPGTAEEAARLRERLGVSIPVLGDPAGAALDALGLTRVLGPLRSSGCVVVDRDGVVRYALRTANPAAALRLPEILRVLGAAP